MSAATFLTTLPFPPDPFQVEAAQAIDDGHSVVVTAPTGAGKTLIAEAAIQVALEAGERAFYTTPIKALSNQKYHDLVAAHGESRVGLLTGDISLNGGADIVVMTTEVLRNMIYAGSDDLDTLRMVILDEVHYLADRSRGAVWEEVIIHAPQRTQLVCLSATISNPEEFAAWIRQRRGETTLVRTTHRPVPLEPMYAVKDRWSDDRITLRPILVDGRANRAILHQLAARGQGTAGRQRSTPPRRFVTPRRLETLQRLQSEGMLPAIYFIFSRAGCEQAAETVATTWRRRPPEMADRIVAIAEERTRHVDPADLAALEYGLWLDRLTRGVAAHHAGMVPAFKEVVERCFVEGLLDVVFATETLALGINMPARSVVLEQLTKFDGEGHEMLTASEYTQLTGRAGRRGIDDLGFGVVLHSPWVRFERVVELVGTGASRLESSFRPTYNMAVNLVANYPEDVAEQLLAASFAQFRRDATMTDDHVADLVAELEAARRAAECERGDVWEYLSQREGGGAGAAALFDRLRPGDVIDIPKGSRPGRYVILGRGSEAPLRLTVLSAGGKVTKLPAEDIGLGSAKLGWVTWKGPFRPRDKQFLRSTTQRLRNFRPTMNEPLVTEVAAAHPVAACPDLRAHETAAATVYRLEQRLSDAGLPITGSLVAEFRAVIGVLRDRGYLADWQLTASGERLRAIYSDRDLLIAEVLRSGILDELGAADLAAVISGFVYDPRGETSAAEMPTLASHEAAAAITAVWETLSVDERTRRLPGTPPPEFGFARGAYAWTAGADLEDLLTAAPMPVGDFVRVARQVLDVLRQVRDAEPSLASTVREAIRGMDRGIVATGAP